MYIVLLKMGIKHSGSELNEEYVRLTWEKTGSIRLY